MSFSKLSYTFAALLAVAAISGPVSSARATVLITEVNSNGAGGDFFELYNYGASAIDLGGYLWTDNSAPAYNGANTYTLSTYSLAPGAAVVIVADAGQGGAGNAAFATSWGSPLTTSAMGGFSGPIPPNPALTGRGFGQNDSVLLWDPTGNFVSGVNYGTSNLTVTSVGGTSTLAPFNRVGGGTSAGGHAGVAGGGTALQSLIWDPTSSVGSPLYTSATSVGLYGSFANASSSTTIGSPSVVPEPSSVILAVLGGGLALAGAARRRLMRATA
jgi:hypothetical protein